MPKYQGKYERLNLIGKGKYGIIYKIRCLQNGKEYVAKHIDMGQIEEQNAKKQLQIIQKLRHPYIVEYIDSFIQEQQFIIVMEYCKEKDLMYHIDLMKAKQKHFSENLIVTWLFQLVLGMQFIHSKKVLHRDIKPQNVFVDENLNIKIGDFGISKILASTGDQCKTMIGTPYYMAPEICSEEKYTSKADIWSLGCVIYEICTLERPFQAKGIFQLIEEIKVGKIGEIASMYSKDLRRLVKIMMTRDQSKRPNTAQLLKDPVLVDLMIKNSSSMSLKKEYSKEIEKPKTLTDSFIDRQTEAVHQQLKDFESEVQAKMQGLKQKVVHGNDIDQHYAQMKQKMAEIEKAIGKAFVELKNKTNENEKNSEETQRSNKSSSKISSSKNDQTSKKSCALTDSDDMTVIQSVVYGDNKSQFMSQNAVINKKQSPVAKSTHIAAHSASYESVPVIQTKSNIQFPHQLKNNSNISAAQSVEIRESLGESFTGKKPNDVSLMIESKVDKNELSDWDQSQSRRNNDPLLESQSLDATLMSEYQKTLKDKSGALAKETMNKLQFLKNTLLKNPDAVLNGSLLNFTLTMSDSNVNLSRGQNLGHNSKSNQESLSNSLSMRLKNKHLDDTITLDLTKKQIEESSSTNELSIKAFKKKKESDGDILGSRLNNEAASKEKLLTNPSKLSQSDIQVSFQEEIDYGEEDQDVSEYLQEEFQDYDQEAEQDYEKQFQDADLEFSKRSSMKERRKSQLNTIISFYQQTLQDINQSELNNESTSPEFRVKNKYPLVMSEIKEQSGEGGSILSRNNRSGNDSSI